MLSLPLTSNSRCRSCQWLRLRCVSGVAMPKYSWMALVGVSLLSGCGSMTGPPSITASRTFYNEVIHDTSSEQLLLNIVRAKNYETPNFIDVSEADATVSFTSGVNGGLSGIGAVPGIHSTSAGTIGRPGGRRDRQFQLCRFRACPLRARPRLSAHPASVVADRAGFDRAYVQFRFRARRRARIFGRPARATVIPTITSRRTGWSCSTNSARSFSRRAPKRPAWTPVDAMAARGETIARFGRRQFDAEPQRDPPSGKSTTRAASSRGETVPSRTSPPMRLSPNSGAGCASFIAAPPRI